MDVCKKCGFPMCDDEIMCANCMTVVESKTVMALPLASSGELATNCLICGEVVSISHYSDTPKICDKCKDAVLEIREFLVRLRGD